MSQSIRLTNDIRSSMRTALIDQKFEKQRKDIFSRKAKIAEMLYSKIVPYKQRELAESLPEGWIDYCRQAVFRININDASVQMVFLQFIYKPGVEIPKVNSIEDCSRRSNYGLDIGIDDSLITDVKRAQIVQIFKDLEQLEKAKSELHRELTAILWSTNSSKKLFEAWPEGEQFLPKEFQYVKTTEIAKIDTSRVNKILGGK